MKVCDLQRDQDRRVTPVLEKIRGCNIRRMGAKGSQVPDARQGGHMQVSSATKNEWGIMPHSLKRINHVRCKEHNRWTVHGCQEGHVQMVFGREMQKEGEQQ